MVAKDASLLREDWIKQRKKKKASFYQRTFLFSVHPDTVEQQLSVPVLLYLHKLAFPDIFHEKTFHQKSESKPQSVYATSQSHIRLSHTHPPLNSKF